MAYFSPEEDNYVRICLLLSGISPRAARNYFDYEFAPASLDATLKKQYNDLFVLKNKQHRISQSQWKLLFPTYPDTPDSKTFDITLMITLLRNLAKVTPPHKGFDCLPAQTEITNVADLARIKYYRNLIAHMDDGKIEKTDFNTAWENISGAIERLGGKQMKIECDQLKTKVLDPTNKEIMMNIKQARDEIKELNESLDFLKRSHEVLKEDHAETTKKMEILKAAQNDTVPWNVRARMKTKLQAWKDDDDMMFINTRAAQHVVNCLMENSCVTITASSGVGKTYTLRHVALQSAQEEYDVLVMTDPGDIVKFYNPDKKTLFVVDDLCGNFSVDQSDLKVWERIMDDIKSILEDKKTKIIAACRLQVYTDKKFENLSVFNSCVCNMSSEILALSIAEKQLIAEKYLKTKASEISSFYDLYDCFPLLCKLYHANSNLNVTDFFQNPFSVYEEEINNLRIKGHYTKYCALALCVMFNNNLKEEILTEDVKEETMTIIEKTCEVCNLPRGTSRNVLHDELDSLKDSFIKKEQNIYKVIHDKIFDFLTFIYGQQIIYCLIKQADSGLIKQRFAFEKTDDMDQFVIIIPKEYHQIYMQRMIEDWSKRKIQDVFSNINMNVPQFKHNFLSYLKSLDLSYQIQLAHTCDDQSHGGSDDDDEDDEDDNDDDDNDDDEDDEIDNDENDGDVDEDGNVGGVDEKKEDGNVEGISVKEKDGNKNEELELEDDDNASDDDGDTVLLQCCILGDISLVQWCCNLGVDVERCTCFGESPVMKACEYGHTEVVEFLLDREVNYDKCDNDGQSPLMKASANGHTEIVTLLLYRGVNYNKRDNDGESSIMLACEQGHSEIVRMFLRVKVNYNKRDKYGKSPLFKACENGHTKIVRYLLQKGANFNNCDSEHQSPLFMACRYGPTEIFKALLEKGAHFDDRNTDTLTPFMKACYHGHVEIVKILLDKGADYNRGNRKGESPITLACDRGSIEIVKMLLDRGQSCNKFDLRRHESLITKACRLQHTEIVKLLLDRGAKCHGKFNSSPIYAACCSGNTKIFKMLLDHGVDYNTCDCHALNTSPIMIACKYGHTEIVNMLLDRGACYTEYDDKGRTPVMLASEMGHAEIVKILLNKGVDYHECDNKGLSPLSNARTGGHTEILKM